MFLVSSCRCFCPSHWSQVLSREWRCSRSSADRRRCSNNIWVINNFIVYEDVSYIRGFYGILIAPTEWQNILPSDVADKVTRLCFYQTRSAWSMDQGSNRKHSAVHNFAPTVTKFCVMWEGQALPHDTKFSNCRCEIVGRRVIFIWSLIPGSSWSGLIKAEPEWRKIVYMDEKPTVPCSRGLTLSMSSFFGPVINNGIYCQNINYIHHL